jgi:diacylglycerol kinase family enzyme
VLPLGTLNHFARDVGLPLGLDEAARVIATGAARPVDVGEVNGHTFLNNSSLGLYPRIVKERDEQRLHLGRNKWLALLAAAFSVFRRFPTVELRLHADGETLSRKTPLLFVGNNKYEIRLLSVRGRACLDRGELCVYIVRSTSRFGLLWLALRSLLGRLDQARDFDALCVPECWIESRRRRLRVAFDGETAVLTPPLHYRSRPGALRVLLPGEVP